MKNILFIVGISLLIIMIGACDENSSQKDKENKAKAEKEQPTKIEPVIIKDSRGNVTERQANSYRKKDGSLRSSDKYFYTYDDNNNVIHEVKESYTPDGDLDYRNVNNYVFNDKNQTIELRFESFDGNDELQRKARHTYAYDKNGYKIEDIGYFDNGDIMSKIILDPDETGALRSEEYIYYNEDGSKKSDKKYFYSSTGLEKTVDLMKDK